MEQRIWQPATAEQEKEYYCLQKYQPVMLSASWIRSHFKPVISSMEDYMEQRRPNWN